MVNALETLGHITAEEDRLKLSLLVREINAKRVVEVGCYVGMTTRSLVDSSPEVIVHAIDHFEGNPSDLSRFWYEDHGKEKVQRTFCENLSDVLFDRVFLHVGTSEFYASIWPFQVDLVFLDASHDYESVKKDIAVWAPHVRPGGILCGHDYGTKVYDSRTNEIGQQYDGVAAAVSEILPASVNGAVWKKQM